MCAVQLNTAIGNVRPNVNRPNRGSLRLQASTLAIGLLLVCVASAQTTSYQTLERKVPRAAIANPKPRVDVMAIPAANQGAISNDVQRMGPSPGVPRIPNVVGLLFTDADSALLLAGFKTKRTFEDAPDPSVLYGHVRATVPGAGALAKAGDVVELKIPRAASKVGIGALSPSDVERRDGFDLDEGQYQEMTRGADVVLRAYKDEPKIDSNGHTYYTGHGLYIEPSDGAILAYLDDTRDIDAYGLGSYPFYAQCEDALEHRRFPSLRIDNPDTYTTFCVKTSEYQIAVVQFRGNENPCCSVTDYKFHYALFPPELLPRPRLPTELKRIRK